MSISPSTRAPLHDRHDDLRSRFEAARQVSRVGIHIVHDDRLLLAWRRRRRCRGREGCACAATACRETARARARRLRADRCRPRCTPASRASELRRRAPWRACGSRSARQCLVDARRATDCCVSRVFMRQSFNSRNSRSRPPRIGTICRPVDVACRRPNATRRGSVSGQARRRPADLPPAPVRSGRDDQAE